jgi:hypothetical protein
LKVSITFPYKTYFCYHLKVHKWYHRSLSLYCLHRVIQADAAEADVARSQAAEALRVAEAELAASRQRLSLLEASAKAREKEVERLQRVMELNKTSEVGSHQCEFDLIENGVELCDA